MALFKISKGSSSDLLISSASRYAKEGSAWFTPDDGKFYIDIAGDGTSSSPAVLSGAGRNRIALNADTADRTAAALLIKSGQKNGTFANESRFDGSQETLLRLGHSIYYVEGNTTGNAGAWTGTLPNNVTPTDGFTIAYKVGVPGAATTTLALSNGVQTLTHTVYGGLSVPVGTTILLVYSTVSNTGRWSVANTDEKVKITSSSTDAEYPILASAASSITSGNAYNALYKSGVTINPSTGIITATKLKGELYNSLRLDVGESFTDEFGQTDTSEINTYIFDNTDTLVAEISADTVGALSLRNGGIVYGDVTFEQSINADITGNASSADYATDAGTAGTADALSNTIDILYYNSYFGYTYDSNLNQYYTGTLATGVDGSQSIVLDLSNFEISMDQVSGLYMYLDDYAMAAQLPLVLIPTDNSHPELGGSAILYDTSWWQFLNAFLTGRSVIGQIISGNGVSDWLANIFYLDYVDCVQHEIQFVTHVDNYTCVVSLQEDDSTGDIAGTYSVTIDYTHPSYQAETAGAYLIGRDNQGHVTFGGSITPAIIGAVDKSGDYMTGHLTLAGATNTGLGNCTTMLKFATAAAPATTISQITANDSGFIAFSKGSSYTDSNAIGYDGTRNAFRPTGTNTTASLGTSTNPFANVYATNLHGTADQVANNLVITLDGGTTEGSDKFTYNGYTTKTINITAANTGAALLNHDHDNDYVPLSRTVNSKSLSSDITLTYSDIGAAASSHTHGIINNNGTVSNTTQGYILAIGDSNGTITTKSIDDYGIAYSNHLHDERYLQKTTYEWNKEIAFGGANSGKLLIGKFPMYDSNVTITINSTTSTTYHCTAVLATQNINTSGGGTITWHTYDDASNFITPNLYLYYPPDSRNIEIYFSPSSWSKNLIHIQAVALHAAPAENEICSKVFVGTNGNTTATQWQAWLDSHAVVTSGSGRRSPTNMLQTNYATKSHTHALTNIIGENSDKGKLVIVSNDNNKYLVTSTINDLGIAQIADLPGNATSSTAGLMTAAQYTKLEGIASGAEVNQNAFSTVQVKVGNITTNLDADSKTDTFTIEAGDNVTLTPNATTDTLIIAATDTIYTLPHATNEALGGIKTGYTTNSKNYAVALDSNDKAYVNVTWENTWKQNTASQEGYVTAPTNNDKNKVWGVNDSGTPGWIDIATIQAGVSSGPDKYLRGDGVYTNVLYDKYVSHFNNSNSPNTMPGYVLRVAELGNASYKDIIIEYDAEEEALCYIFNNFS